MFKLGDKVKLIVACNAQEYTTGCHRILFDGYTGIVTDHLAPAPEIDYSYVYFDLPNGDGYYKIPTQYLRVSNEFNWDKPIKTSPSPKITCECPGKQFGFKDYTRGHSQWCPVYKGD